MLCPNLKDRIKIKEIFSHPWVLKYEKEYKQEKIKRILEEQDEKNSVCDEIYTKKIEKEEEMSIQTLLNNNTKQVNNMNNKVAEKIKIFEKKNNPINLNLINKREEKPIKIKNEYERSLSSFNNCENKNNPPDIIKKETKTNQIHLAIENPQIRNRAFTNDYLKPSKLEAAPELLYSNCVISNINDNNSNSQHDDLFDKVLEKIQDQNNSKRKKNKSLNGKSYVSIFDESSKLNSNVSKKNEDAKVKENKNLNELVKGQDKIHTRKFPIPDKYNKSKNKVIDLFDEDLSKRKKSELIKIKISENFLENEFTYKDPIKTNKGKIIFLTNLGLNTNNNRPSSVCRFKNIEIERNSKFTNIFKADLTGKNEDLSRE